MYCKISGKTANNISANPAAKKIYVYEKKNLKANLLKKQLRYKVGLSDILS